MDNEKKRKVEILKYLAKPRKLFPDLPDTLNGQIYQLMVGQSTLKKILKELEELQTESTSEGQDHHEQSVRELPVEDFVVSSEISQELEELGNTSEQRD